MINKTFLWFILGLILAIVLYVLYRKNFKRIVLGCVTLITGAVKTGKSLLGVWLSQKKYKHIHRVWWFKTHVFKKKIEEPLYYTNTFVTFGHYNPFKPITKRNKRHKLDKNIRLIELEHLLRLKRFNYKSVIYVDESSLMSDNQDYKNEIRNATLSMFNKLIGHETRGGYLFYDTQAVEDNHYSIKRVVSNYHFIQKSINLFFFRILYVREMISKDYGENNFDDDIETTMRKVIVGRWWYKHYDCYYFSYLTDKLPNTSKLPKFYKGALTSFNPLYRKLSLMNRKNRHFLIEEFNKMADELNAKYNNRKVKKL